MSDGSMTRLMILFSHRRCNESNDELMGWMDREEIRNGLKIGFYKLLYNLMQISSKC
jgi:hypothetical protein